MELFPPERLLTTLARFYQESATVERTDQYFSGKASPRLYASVGTSPGVVVEPYWLGMSDFWQPSSSYGSLRIHKIRIGL